MKKIKNGMHKDVVQSIFKGLPKAELARIAYSAYVGIYMDAGRDEKTQVVDKDNPINGTDYIQGMAELFEFSGLTPNEVG